jgi:hypothetical protein
MKVVLPNQCPVLTPRAAKALYRILSESAAANPARSESADCCAAKDASGAPDDYTEQDPRGNGGLAWNLSPTLHEGKESAY